MNFFLETFKKDLKIAMSYRTQFILSFSSIFISVFFMIIFARLIEFDNFEYLKKYDGGYLVFLFFGVISAEITVLMLNTMPSKTREYQLTGVFEELITAKKNEFYIIFGTLLYPTFLQFLRIIIYMVIFLLFFEEAELIKNISSLTAISVALFIISLLGISLISVAFTILYKSPSIINRVYLGLVSILSGVAFPIELLPSWTFFFSYLLPTTHFLEILRTDYSGRVVGFDYLCLNFALLFVLATVLMALGIFLFKKSLKIAKLNGSLLNY